MNIKSALQVILFALSVLILGACKDAWDEHLEISSNDSKLTLLDRIAAEPSLSQFYAYLKETGLDSSLASSKTYTVWAPDNQAINALIQQHPTYLSDSASLNNFVKYHIATLLYPISKSPDSSRVLSLNGLYISVNDIKFEEASITKADLLAKNGFLHIVDKALVVKTSIFSAAKDLAGSSQQGLAMQALDTAAVNDLGEPITKRSAKWSSLVSKMSSKDSLFTFFVLSDAAYEAELNKIVPYYASTKIRPDSTTSYLTKIAMMENLLVRGSYNMAQLPDTLISVAGVKLPIKKSAIVNSYRANNGMVYVLNELPYRLKDRVKSFKIEGEQTNKFFSRNDKNGNIYYRSKLDSLGIPFYDIQVHNQGVANFYVQYRRPETNTVAYDVYVRAVSGTIGDLQTVAFTQRYGVPNALIAGNTDVLFTKAVTPLRYSEVYLGQFTFSQYGTLNWRVLGANSTAINVNTIMVDYLRFVPVLPN